MNCMLPVKSKETIDKIKTYLKDCPSEYALFVLGINLPLRVGDLVKLKKKDIYNVQYARIKEQKTGKTKLIYINESLSAEIKKYASDKNEDDYLFPSKKGNRSHISRHTAYRWSRKIAEEFKLEHFSVHAYRKVFGYFFIQQGGSLPILQKIYNHHSQSVTMRYCSIEQSEIDTSLMSFHL
jgi:integrase